MPGCGERHHEAGGSEFHFRSVNTAVPTGTSERSNRKIHRNPIRITVDLMDCVDKKDAGILGEFLRLLFSSTLLYYNSCDLSTKIDKIWNFCGIKSLPY